MARGWESKAIESQQDAAAQAKAVRRSRERTPEEKALIAQREVLELARTRVIAQVAKATAPVHRVMLEHALKSLDDQLRDIDSKMRTPHDSQP